MSTKANKSVLGIIFKKHRIKCKYAYQKLLFNLSMLLKYLNPVKFMIPGKSL